MRLDDLPWEDTNKYWRHAKVQLPNSVWLKVARGKPSNPSGWGDHYGFYLYRTFPSEDVHPFKVIGYDGGGRRYIPLLEAQCVLYDLFANPPYPTSEDDADAVR